MTGSGLPFVQGLVMGTSPEAASIRFTYFLTSAGCRSCQISLLDPPWREGTQSTQHVLQMLVAHRLEKITGLSDNPEGS